MPTRIVVDTNVLISALIGSTGPSRELIRRCLRYDYQPLVGTTLFCEYESVSSRPDILELCPIEQSEVDTIVQSFVSISEWISIYYSWRPNLKDEADNHLIELAIAGNAHAIVTHNIKDFKNADLFFPELVILKPEDILRK